MSSAREYLKKAMKAHEIPSQRQLAKRLGISAATLSEIWLGRIPPSERITLALAEMAGIDPRQALLDRMTWTAKDPAAKKLYADIAKTFGAALLLGTWIGPPGGGSATASQPRTVAAVSLNKETDREQISARSISVYVMALLINLWRRLVTLRLNRAFTVRHAI